MDRAKQVAFAKHLLMRDGFFGEAIGLGQDATSRPGDHFAGYVAAHLFCFGNTGANSPDGWDLDQLDVALEAAKAGDHIADAASRLAIISAMKFGLEIPAALRDFQNSALLSPAARPSAHRNAKPDGPARDALILWVIYRLVDVYGLKPTRNTLSAPDSACDIVSDALRAVDRENAQDYDNLRKIWSRRDALSYRPADLWGKKT